MTKTFGYPLETWEEAKKEARQILIRCAKDDQTIAYSDLVAEIYAIRTEPQDPKLAEMLDQISSAEHAAGRGMLSVLVVHKGDDGMPGNGFFDLAKRLDKRVDDKLEFWVKEFKRVTCSWR